MSEYDIEPADNPPTFEFDEDKVSDEEREYVLAYMILLQQFYDKYKFKSADYVIENVEKDTAKLHDNFIENNKKLEKFHDISIKEELRKNGVVSGKIKEATNEIDTKLFDDELGEQHTTILSITTLLGLGILSTAYHSRARSEPKLFNIDSNVRNAVTRTQNMASAGYTSTKGLAQNSVLKLLFGDPLMDWIPHPESSVTGVCPNCQNLVDNNPHKLSEIPLNYLHLHCCCTRELHNKENSYTAKALNWIFY